jgi:hypothetical protein
MVNEYNQLHMELELAMDRLTVAENNLEDHGISINDIENILRNRIYPSGLSEMITEYLDARSDVENLS